MKWEILTPSRLQRSVPSLKGSEEMKGMIHRGLSERGRALFFSHLAEAKNGKQTR